MSTHRSRDTQAIHAGLEATRQPGAPVFPAVVQSATFYGGGPEDSGPLLYTRYGNNPNQVQVGEKLAVLEGAEDGLVVSSGMAAISLGLLSVLDAGSHLVSTAHLYGATRTFMEEELPRRGVTVTLIDPDEDGGWESALEPNTRALYLELPTNPTLRFPDLRPVAALATRRGIPLLVDSTFATPVNFRPLEHGASLVLHSATKYLGGHSDLIAGAVLGSAERVSAVRTLLHRYGPSLDPHAAFLLERGIRTLAVRMDRHNAQAEALAQWFKAQPEVEAVHHLSLPEHPDHALAKALMDGFGGMLGLVVAGGAPAAEAFVQDLRVASLAPSLGGVETLVSLPALTSHRHMSLHERERMGVPDGFVRISVGLEGLEDLKADFEAALGRVRQRAH